MDGSSPSTNSLAPPPSLIGGVERRVGIFWDYENCSPPANTPGYIVAERIRDVAHNFGAVTLFKAYLELSSTTTSAKMINLRSELQSSGVSLTDCPRGSTNRKEVVDKMLLVDMLTFAMDNPAPAVIMLISGDRDFVYAVSVLRHRKYDVVLVIPPQGAHITLKHQANVVLEWKYDIFEESAVRGGSGGADASSSDAASEDGRPMYKAGHARRPSTPPKPFSPMGTTLLPAPEFNDIFGGVTGQVRSPSSGLPQMPVIPLSPSTPPQTRIQFGAVHNDLSSPTPGSSMTHRRTRSSQVATPVRYTANTNGTGPVEVPRMFANLVEVLEEFRLLGNDKPLRSVIGMDLKKKHPWLYERNGVKSFSDYVRSAEKQGVVSIGGSGVAGQEWISLEEKYRGHVYPAMYAELQSP